MAVHLQIAGGLGIYYERIAVTLGFATLLAIVATFVSCRSFISLIGRYAHMNLMENTLYKSFYRYHAYYWWLFLIVLVIHIMSATIHTELLPGHDDPDALEHWMIIGFALSTLAVISIQFFSCRSFASLAGLFTRKNPVKFRLYSIFYKFHS